MLCKPRRPFRRPLCGALLSGAAALAIVTPQTWAQQYPDKAITIVVPFAAGSGTDQTARVYGQAVSEYLNVPVVIDNKGGASGFIAAQHVARANPDGYTIMLATNTTQVANPALFKTLPYDPVQDFAPIALLSTGQLLLMVRPDAPWQSLGDLLAAARQTPGKLNFGSGSSSSLVTGELLKQMAQIDVVNVPYKSIPHGVVDLIGGQIDFMFVDAPNAVIQLQGGKLRALAASSAKRLSVQPDIPTVHEAGLPGYDMTYWFAVYAPARTPEAIVARLNQAFAHASEAPGVKAYLEKTGGATAFGTPQALAQFQAAELQKWTQVIQAAGIEPQ